MFIYITKINFYKGYPNLPKNKCFILKENSILDDDDSSADEYVQNITIQSSVYGKTISNI